jgi:hypothetical protein
MSAYRLIPYLPCYCPFAFQSFPALTEYQP